jgi:hypothetical protein
MKPWYFVSTALLVLTICACSSSSTAPAAGCDVSFADVQTGGTALVTTAFHDATPDGISWQPTKNVLDLIIADRGAVPTRTFELKLSNNPISDGIRILLEPPDPTMPSVAPSDLGFVNDGISAMTSVNGSVHFTTASDSLLVFTLEDATLAVLDKNGKATPGAPAVTVSMTCAVDVHAAP